MFVFLALHWLAATYYTVARAIPVKLLSEHTTNASC